MQDQIQRKPHRQRGQTGAIGGFMRYAMVCGALLATQGAMAVAKPIPEPLPADVPLSTQATIDPQYKQRLYVPDFAISHIIDGRIRVLDAPSGKFLGIISTGYAGNMTMSNQRDVVYVATTHMSKSYRGERQDVLEAYGADDLALHYEVPLPPKRAQALNYQYLVSTTANGRFVLVQNATPATSITVVDTQTRKVASEISTPGCWGALPAASHGTRFSTLCGDGTVQTITLDDQGQLQERQSSAVLFDADNDAWFHTAARAGDRYWYVSFQGKVTELNLGGAKAQVVKAYDLTTAAERKGGWRPGGYQNAAIDSTGRYLVVGMHPKGGEGSHKIPASKLFVLDTVANKRLPNLPGHMAVAIGFSHSGERLHVVDGTTNTLHVMGFKGGKVRPINQIPTVGEVVLQLESYD